MANYTDGLPIPGQFPLHIKRVIDDIIETLQHHPLSLANIGISINSSRVTDTRQWEVIRENLYLHLDENDLHRPPAYDRPYSLPVRASMMLMVESLPLEARRLLFLMALLGGQSLPEPLVKYFYRFIQADSFALKYNNQEKFLEDKSLIEILSAEGNRSLLDCHSLRSRYIREMKAQEVRSLGSQILIASGPNEDDVSQPIQRGDREQTLVAILGATYYDRAFKDIISSTLEKHIEVLNDGVIPRSLNVSKDNLDVVNNARRHQYKVEKLAWLLRADHEEVDWKNQAHEHAKKIIIKFVCQGRLDDDSMASLLKHPQTTSVACKALYDMSYCHRRDYCEQKITFSSAYSEIVQTLLALVHDNGISVERRAEVMDVLFHILSYESKDTILEVVAQYKALLAMDSRPNFRVAMMDVFWTNQPWRGVRFLVECSGLVEDLMKFLLFGKEQAVRLSAARTVHSIVVASARTRVMERIAVFPNALQQLFELFISQDMFVAYDELQLVAGDILRCESMVPETRIKFREIRGIWEGLGAILGNLERVWRETRENDNRMKLERRACVAASILAYLALEEDLRETISSLRGVHEGLLFLQLTEIFRSYLRFRDDHDSWSFVDCYWSTTALTVLCSNLSPTEPSFTTLPPLEEVLKLSPEFDHGAELKAMGSSLPDIVYVGIYWSRVLAYIELRAYVESLSNLDLAKRHLNLILKLGQDEIWCCSSRTGVSRYFTRRLDLCKSALSHFRVFLQAIQGDYAGAFESVSILDCGLEW